MATRIYKVEVTNVGKIFKITILRLLGGRIIKSVFEFKGISKEKKRKLVRKFLQFEWKNIILSYFFIVLSSSRPFISSMNGAIYVAVWYSFAVFLSIKVYIDQSDYIMRKKRGKHYFKKHKEMVEKGSIFIPQIGGWNAIAMQLLVAIVFYLIEIPISLYLQFKNMDIYQKVYKSLFVGVFADTYIVVFCNGVISMFIDYIYDCVNSRTRLKEKILNANLKKIIVFIVLVIVLILAFVYYFNNEFKGLSEDRSIVRRVAGSIYILFMTWPLFKCIKDVTKKYN